MSFFHTGMVNGIFLAVEVAVIQEHDACGGTFGSPMEVAKLHTLRTFKCRCDVAREVFPAVIGIPRGAKFRVIPPFDGIGIHGVAVNDDFQRQCRFLVRIMFLSGAVLVFALELQHTIGVTVTNDGVFHRMIDLHAIFFLHLLDNR